MSDDFTQAFERLWVALRARWCDSHDLDGALAFTHDQVKIPFFHRIVQVHCAKVDRLIDDALSLYREKDYDCIFTLSPLDRPTDLGQRLQQRGFTAGSLASAMVHAPTATPAINGAIRVELADEGEYDVWNDVSCRSFEHPPAMGEIGRSALLQPDVRRYLARVDSAPAGAALLCSQGGLGYIDLVGTLCEFRRQGVASALILQAVADSVALGNRWTALETITGSAPERLYQRLGFRTAYNRHRYIMDPA